MNWDRLVHRLILAVGILLVVQVFLLAIIARNPKTIIDLLKCLVEPAWTAAFVFLAWKYLKIKEAEEKCSVDRIFKGGVNDPDVQVR